MTDLSLKGEGRDMKLAEIPVPEKNISKILSTPP